MTRTCEVAIIGGGIGGLTLAASLLQQSISVKFLSRTLNFAKSGRELRLPVMRLVCCKVLVSI
jgi:2-polyprenyl-6-methoxyphenol hydroxylase-like FAD-dependent oxidoreductase